MARTLTVRKRHLLQGRAQAGGAVGICSSRPHPIRLIWRVCAETVIATAGRQITHSVSVEGRLPRGGGMVHGDENWTLYKRNLDQLAAEIVAEFVSHMPHHREVIEAAKASGRSGEYILVGGSRIPSREERRP
jgi:hypothetical protein